jgi:dihydrofolate reductase
MAITDSQVTIHMAASLDGFIARRDGSVDWLETSDEFANGESLDPGFIEAFLKTIECYVMGARTYETALRFEAKGVMKRGQSVILALFGSTGSRISLILRGWRGKDRFELTGPIYHVLDRELERESPTDPSLPFRVLPEQGAVADRTLTAAGSASGGARHERRRDQGAGVEAQRRLLG